MLLDSMHDPRSLQFKDKTNRKSRAVYRKLPEIQYGIWYSIWTKIPFQRSLNVGPDDGSSRILVKSPLQTRGFPVNRHGLSGQ